MSLRTRQFRLRRPQRQAGVVILLMLTVFVVTASWLLLRSLNAANGQIAREQEEIRLLSQAKEALLAYAVMPGGAELGQLPWPDVLNTISEASPDYDGTQDLHCPDTSSSIRPSLNVNSRCFGRLPWRSLNMTPQAIEQQDGFGLIPWYAVSANLLDAACLAGKLNPAILNWTYPASPVRACNVANQLPYPWLTVRDHLGNVLSNRVAFVLILPRVKVNTQNRRLPLGIPRQYLDQVTVASTCTAPCVPGVYDNGAFSPGNDFIMGKDMSLVKGNDSNYGHPYVFNDRLLYVTIDELMQYLQKRAMQEARNALRNFFTSKAYFPYAAALGVSGNACDNTKNSGFLPLALGTCASGDFLSGLPSWFNSASWGNFIYYHAAAACTPGSSNCNGPGSLLQAGSQGSLRAILIGTGRPIKLVAGQTPDMSTPPYAASAGRDQTGCCSSTLLQDYLDSVTNAAGNGAYDAVGTAMSTQYNDVQMVVSP
ncbi:hypothetical protein V8J88_09555 [Massilia sp. W12]|uniref:hypothetical protein n=1 Tax=Massilia sp. W12 TaxID=3126507 RepID=UPI0030D346CB